MDFNGELNFKDNLIIRPEITDYSETVNALGNATGSMSIDISLGNVVTATTTGITSWTFSNPSATGKACMFTLILTNGGAYAQTWPSPATKWPGGTGPTLTASGKDILSFMTIDAGTTWNAVVAGLDVK